MPTLEDLPQETRDELALLARELSDSPDTRKDFLRLAQKKRPNMPVPELELDDRVARIETDSTTKIQALENKLAEKDMRAELDRRRQSLISKGLAKDDAEVELIEKVMLDKNIANHETAAEYFNMSRQSATPTPPSYNRNVMDATAKDTLSKYWKNPVTAARDTAAQALNELRRNPKAVGY